MYIHVIIIRTLQANQDILSQASMFRDNLRNFLNNLISPPVEQNFENQLDNFFNLDLNSRLTKFQPLKTFKKIHFSLFQVALCEQPGPSCAAQSGLSCSDRECF